MLERLNLVTVVITTSMYVGSLPTQGADLQVSTGSNTPPSTIDLPSSTSTSVSADIHTTTTLSSFSTTSSRPWITTTYRPSSATTDLSTSHNGPSRDPIGAPDSFGPFTHKKSSVPSAYNPRTLIIVVVILGLILIAALSWLIRRRLRRRDQKRDLEALAGVEQAEAREADNGDMEEDDNEKDEQVVMGEGNDRLSAVGSTFTRPTMMGSSEEYLLNEVRDESRRGSLGVTSVKSMRESIIGVATTTSLPVSSSKSAVCEGYTDRKGLSVSGSLSRMSGQSQDEGQGHNNSQGRLSQFEQVLSVGVKSMDKVDQQTYRAAESIYACYELGDQPSPRA